jgi:hypothetical protein
MNKIKVEGIKKAKYKHDPINIFFFEWQIKETTDSKILIR